MPTPQVKFPHRWCGFCDSGSIRRFPLSVMGRIARDCIEHEMSRWRSMVGWYLYHSGRWVKVGEPPVHWKGFSPDPDGEELQRSASGGVDDEAFHRRGVQCEDCRIGKVLALEDRRGNCQQPFLIGYLVLRHFGCGPRRGRLGQVGGDIGWRLAGYPVQDIHEAMEGKPEAGCLRSVRTGSWMGPGRWGDALRGGSGKNRCGCAGGLNLDGMLDSGSKLTAEEKSAIGPDKVPFYRKQPTASFISNRSEAYASWRSDNYKYDVHQ